MSKKFKHEWYRRHVQVIVVTTAILAI